MTAIDQLILRSPILSSEWMRQALLEPHQLDPEEVINICLSHERLRMLLREREYELANAMQKVMPLEERVRLLEDNVGILNGTIEQLSYGLEESDWE